MQSSVSLLLRPHFCIFPAMSTLKPASLFFAILLLILSCDGLKVPKHIFETSERRKYERSFSGSDSAMANWKGSFSAAVANRLTIPEGTSFVVAADSAAMNAIGYSLELKKGDQLIIESNTNKPNAKIFVDLVAPGANIDDAESSLMTNNRFSAFIENTGLYKVVIQPEIEFSENYGLLFYTQPSLSFPVTGKGNRNVQSFWGASRDGGGRSHEGVDIFASRRTPVVAVADGFITRTGNQGLGGKQVWQRDALLGNSYYYAHLDSILTESGRNVKTGDTLGWVGNTGNAAGGPTHLHFGIYTTGGAVDPYPYIRIRPVPKQNSKTAIPASKHTKAGTNLRAGPGTQYEILTTTDTKTRVRILAVSGSWCHIRTHDGKEGFVLRDRLDP
ncbi:murein DD-endopeptidase MepM/ murein hydrolase activator NlpD [Chryseobacterium sp. SORGH_AS909]|uniref:Murein DD-endopeptidase MepM/ murein hydrolase activator NlpD n=2 Tax=Chryseobacterium group TaxID=2782232 RepID=A0ABU0THE9_9FLAO|nr:murein DD-endopeptidase MepM/ murein hydrolase activator NlpD [Chryseobacterium camelliae]MDQ1100418.1 murein DD-endopeptidase MepM/ murein hydrolase activator NlpD [Chryseobacterium sp. SORGH_AS_1048]MDR6087759.1 murein DD-endopeptidase MepM/ murein hydrolase activator NlpD [Chryseobacterium sp. SORGH_AS_0909]MDR6132135.1 murein DD-endopeptidase MepM/ murein hydrolase activator NlpD [Chryseobacterium sp. SORGH_AS_1175]MDT3405712.1 murein DD-endopeptidase MepM/ murein hydrolase activator Nlp